MTVSHARPTLSVSVDADRPGPREVTLSYLTTGLSWRADYVATFDEPRRALDLQGWITLTNSSGTGFAGVDAQLVAGDVQTSVATGYNRYQPYRPPRATQTKAGSEISGQARLGDFYVYPLRERTTVADQQTKQVALVEGKSVPAQRVYEYRADSFRTFEQPAHADVVLQFSNAQAQGLGAPLPAGVVRVYLRDAKGDAKFAVKASTGLGTLVGGVALDWIGVSPEATRTPSAVLPEGMLERLILAHGPGAALIGLVALAIFAPYGLTRARHDVISAELRARRRGVARDATSPA